MGSFRKIVVMFAALFTAGLAGAQEPTPLTKQYMQAFSGTSTSQAQLHVLNQLQWSGLSDPRLFDLVEQKLLDVYLSAGGKDVDLASWYAKSLGTSGLEKYRHTLQSIVDSAAKNKIRKYAGEGLNNIDRYAVWNPIIANPEGADPGKSEQVNAFANMLRSEDWMLRNMAAKRIYSDNVYDPDLLALLDEAIKTVYLQDFEGNLQIQTVAWMTRALASSRNPVYKPTVEEVAASAGNSKVRSYAKKYLKQSY